MGPTKFILPADETVEQCYQRHHRAALSNPSHPGIYLSFAVIWCSQWSPLPLTVWDDMFMGWNTTHLWRLQIGRHSYFNISKEWQDKLKRVPPGFVMMGDGCVHELFRDLIQELTTAILQAAKAMASHAKVAILPDDNHMKPESKNLIALSNSNEGNRDLAISLFLGQYSTLGKDAESVAGCLLLREIAAIYPIEKPSLICDSYVPKIQFSLPYGDHWKVLILSVSDQIVACVARVQDVSQFRSHANEILRQCLTSLEFNPHRWGWPS